MPINVFHWLEGRVTKLFRFSLCLYKKFFSPLQYVLQVCFGITCECRFMPTCSEYALQCLHKYPLWHALKLIAKRLLRCHPGCEGGYDPVP